MIGNAIVDSACLIALEKIGQIELLSKLFDNIYIPPAVEIEFGKSIDWINVKQIQSIDKVITLKTQLDDGESEVIALAMEMKKVYVILDDKKARRVAKQIGLKVIGTVGILLRAKKNKIIPEIKSYLEKLNNVGFHISEALYQKALEIARED